MIRSETYTIQIGGRDLDIELDVRVEVDRREATRLDPPEVTYRSRPEILRMRVWKKNIPIGEATAKALAVAFEEAISEELARKDPSERWDT